MRAGLKPKRNWREAMAQLKKELAEEEAVENANRKVALKV